MDKKNRNYQRIDKLIIDAFIEMCKKEKTNDITVSSLCDKANINRTTFYNHYKDIWEIIETIETDIINKIDKVLNDFSYFEFIKDPFPTLSKLNNIINEKPEYYKKLFHLSDSHFFIDKLKDIFHTKILQSPNIPKEFTSSVQGQIIISMFIGSLGNVYSDWFSQKINCSLEDITLQISESIKNTAPIMK
ncbi:MAG: TetR/AcrR family transcriptional regulator [Bacilli bacterium]